MPDFILKITACFEEAGWFGQKTGTCIYPGGNVHGFEPSAYYFWSPFCLLLIPGYILLVVTCPFSYIQLIDHHQNGSGNI